VPHRARPQEEMDRHLAWIVEAEVGHEQESKVTSIWSSFEFLTAEFGMEI
jgi:hypothetical protein